MMCSILAAAGIGIEPARADEPPAWYRLRTNSVPHQPQDVILDAEDGLWVTAIEDSEPEPSLWYHAPQAPVGTFQFFTDKQRNNYLVPGFTNLVEKPRLGAWLRYATRDSRGNTLYALRNRTVLCEQADGTWLSFDMPDTSDLGYESVGVDSAHRIRRIDDREGGARHTLLIAARGIVHLDDQFQEVQSLRVYDTFNTSYFNDALIDSQGCTWVASNTGVQKGTNWIDAVWIDDEDDPDAPPLYGPITAIAEDAQQNIWFVSNVSYGSGRVHCYTVAGNWVSYDLSTLLPGTSNQVFAVAAGYAGSVWFGALGSGLLRYDPVDGSQPWKRYTGAELGLQSEAIISLAPSEDGLWFVTDYNPDVPGNGTGVHFLTLDQNGIPQVDSTTYRENSTVLTSNQINSVAADRSGGVWFAADDDPSVARLKAEGSWQQFHGDVDGGSLGQFGVVAVGVDEDNLVYFAPDRQPPVAYDATAEQLADLPDFPYGNDFIIYYGMHIDKNGGKWFCGSFGAYYLDPDNTGWTRYSSADGIPEFVNDHVDDVLVDDAGNVWFMTWGGITLMKKDPIGGDPQWMAFQNGTAGYSGGYRVLVDDDGQVWNIAGQRFDSQSDTWSTAADTGARDRRHLRFLNGGIPVDMDMTGALSQVSTSNQNMMTLDTRGNIYFADIGFGLSSVNAGIVVRSPVRGDVDRNGRLDLADAVRGARILTGRESTAQSHAIDVDGDGRVGTPEVSFVLRRIAGM